MMSSPIPSLIICILYVYIVEIGLPRFMEKRKPLEFRNLMVAYNFAMVALSGYIFVEVSKAQFVITSQLVFSIVRTSYGQVENVVF